MCCVSFKRFSFHCQPCFVSLFLPPLLSEQPTHPPPTHHLLGFTVTVCFDIDPVELALPQCHGFCWAIYKLWRRRATGSAGLAEIPRSVSTAQILWFDFVWLRILACWVYWDCNVLQWVCWFSVTATRRHGFLPWIQLAGSPLKYSIENNRKWLGAPCLSVHKTWPLGSIDFKLGGYLKDRHQQPHSV